MPVDQELSALATVASLLPTDIIYIVRDPGGVAEADHRAAVSVLDARYPGAVISVFGRTGAVVATSGDYSAGQISGLGTLAVLNSPLAIANGGSGQITQQAAIDVLTNVTAATNEHVLTKDTASGNVIFKAAAGGSSLPVADTQTIVKGSADATKLLRFEVDGFTAGATRVMTPPNQDTLLAGQNFANVFTVAQTIQGALAVAPTTNAFGTSSIYTAFVIGNLTGSNGANGGLFSIARHNKANEPFTAFTGWDDGSTRLLYFGGGGWAAPDATGIIFYVASAYNESNDAATPRLAIKANGKIALGINFDFTSLAGASVLFDPDGLPATFDQYTSTEAQPVIKLIQSDLSEEFIEFSATIGTGNSIEAVGAKTLTTTHFIRVSVNGSFVYIPAGTIA